MSFFKKVKIRFTNGLSVRRLYFFGYPILDYYRLSRGGGTFVCHLMLPMAKSSGFFI